MFLEEPKNKTFSGLLLVILLCVSVYASFYGLSVWRRRRLVLNYQYFSNLKFKMSFYFDQILPSTEKERLEFFSKTCSGAGLDIYLRNMLQKFFLINRSIRRLRQYIFNDYFNREAASQQQYLHSANFNNPVSFPHMDYNDDPL